MTLADGRPARANARSTSLELFPARDLVRPPRPLLPRPALPADGVRPGRGRAGARAGAGRAGAAHMLTYDLGAAVAAGALDVDEYCRKMLRVSVAAEIRPESSDRARALHRGAAGVPAAVYGGAAARARARGDLVEREPGVFSVARPAKLVDRLRLSVLLRLVEGPGHRALGQVRRYVRRLAGVHPAQGMSPQRPGHPVDAGERRLPLVFLGRACSATSATRTADAGKRARVRRGAGAGPRLDGGVCDRRTTRGRGRGAQRRAVRAGRGQLPRPLVHVGPRPLDRLALRAGWGPTSSTWRASSAARSAAC